jgi:hypothetical protein
MPTTWNCETCTEYEIEHARTRTTFRVEDARMVEALRWRLTVQRSYLLKYEPSGVRILLFKNEVEKTKYMLRMEAGDFITD